MTIFDYVLIGIWFMILFIFGVSFLYLLKDPNILNPRAEIKVSRMIHGLWIIPLIISYRIWG